MADRKPKTASQPRRHVGTDARRVSSALSALPRFKRKVVMGLSLLLIIGYVAKLVDTRYPWLWAYLLDQIRPQTVQASAGPTHVLFTFVDHFEPHDQATMDRWMSAYPQMAARHRDADGRFPQHSWFWHFSYADGFETLSYLKQLAELSYQGFGEVELHLHHGPDSEESFLELMRKRLQLSRWTGSMVTAETRPQTHFGFIHGLWALDNSRGGKTCGVNNELTLLARLGCYADFTHPSWGPMHPRMVNRLYYATDDPMRPKSYDRGPVMQVGRLPIGDLLIFEGPSVVRLRGIKPVYDHGDVTQVDLPTSERVDAWVRTGIHVEGRPEWVFIKVYTHGAIARDHEAVLGRWSDRMHEYLEGHYNDGERYVLHYVTAREAYNIAKAAEVGKSGDPNAFRDFVIPPYANRTLIASVPYELISADEEKLWVRLLTPPSSRVSMRLHARVVDVSGDASDIVIEPTDEDTGLTLATTGEGIVTFEYERRGINQQVAHRADGTR